MFRRRPRRRDPSAVVDDIRRTIVQLDEQRRLAAASAGRALVSQAEVQRACADQLAALSAAFGVAENAEVAAVAAARSAHADGDPEAAGYERTAAALQGSQRVLGAAAEPIHTLMSEARRNTANAHEVLARARETLDAQLRDQVRILRDFERAEQRREVAELRRRPT